MTPWEQLQREVRERMGLVHTRIEQLDLLLWQSEMDDWMRDVKW